jgi:hypothetical protein
MLAAALLISLLSCKASNNQDKPKQVPGPDQPATSQKSTNAEPLPSSPPGNPTNQKDKHTENLTKPAPHTTTPQAGSGNAGQSSSSDAHKSQ